MELCFLRLEGTSLQRDIKRKESTINIEHRIQLSDKIYEYITSNFKMKGYNLEELEISLIDVIFRIRLEKLAEKGFKIIEDR